MTELITNDKQAMNALKQHGGKIVWAIVVVLFAFFGWQWYQKHYAKIDTVAADQYTQIAAQSDQILLLAQNPDAQIPENEKEALFAQMDTLVAEHESSVYAWQALMLKARHQADSKAYTAAIESLTKASTISLEDEGLLTISKLQLATVLLAADKIDEALSAAQQSVLPSFEPSRLEILGDVLLAKGDELAAKENYQKAWDLLAERHENRALLKLKMQSLGMNPSDIDPKNQVVVLPNLG